MKRIQISKVKIGTWKPRTKYRVSVDGEVLGDYDSVKEAKGAANSRISYLEDYWKSLSEEVGDGSP